MDFLEELRELGVDTEDAVKRFAGKASIYEKLIKKFPCTVKEHIILPDFGDDEVDDAIEKTHALKGVSGNLLITPLYNGYSDIVRLLREGNLHRQGKNLKNLYLYRKA